MNDVGKKEVRKTRKRIKGDLACMCRHNPNVYRVGAEHNCVLPEAKQRYTELVNKIKKTLPRLQKVQRKYQIAQVIHQIGHSKGRPKGWWAAVNNQQFTVEKNKCYAKMKKITNEMDSQIANYLKWIDKNVAPDLMDQTKHPNHPMVCEDFRSITCEVLNAPFPAVKRWAGTKYLPALTGEGSSVWSGMFAATFANQISFAYAMLAQDAMPYLFLKGQKIFESGMNFLFNGKEMDGKKLSFKFEKYNLQWDDIFKTHDLKGSVLKLKDAPSKLPTGKAATAIEYKINIKAFTKTSNALIAACGAAALLMNILYVREREKKDWINTGAGALAFSSAVLDYTVTYSMYNTTRKGMPIPGIDDVPKNLQRRLRISNIFGKVAIALGLVVAGWDTLNFAEAGDYDAAAASGVSAVGGVMCLFGGPVGVIGALLTVAGIVLVAIFTDPPLLKWAKTSPFGSAPKRDNEKESWKKLNKILEEFKVRRVTQLLAKAEQLRFDARPLPAGIHKVEPKQLISDARRLENEAILLSLRRKKS